MSKAASGIQTLIVEGIWHRASGLCTCIHYTLPIRVRFRQKSKSDIIDKWFIEEETKIKEKRGQVCLFLLRKIQRWVNNNLISGKRNNVKIEKLNASLLGR